MTAYSEARRQIVHITMAGFALLLRYMTPLQAAGLAVLAIGFNVFALGVVAPEIIRATDRHAARAGVLFYPLAVLLLILAFPSRLDIVAAAWGVMAFGDGFATLVGSRIGGRTLPWNAKKTWAGLVAFVVFGSAGAVALSLWVAPAIDPMPSRMFSIVAPIAAAIVAALVETMPIELDDNLSVPASAAAVLWFATQIEGLPPDWATILAKGALWSAPVALVAWLAGAVTIGGALAGFAIAVVIYANLELGGLVVLGVALALTVAASRLGRAKKEALGIAEERAGRRGVGNILANCVVGAAGACVAPVVMVAGIAAGASDTVASEIGKAWGGQPRSFPSFRAVPPGTPGAVSAIGTGAGLVAAALIAAPAVAFGGLLPEAVPVVVIACTAGAFLESALATRFEAANILDNNTLNFLNTAAAAGLAVLLS